MSDFSEHKKIALICAIFCAENSQFAGIFLHPKNSLRVFLILIIHRKINDINSDLAQYRNNLFKLLYCLILMNLDPARLSESLGIPLSPIQERNSNERKNLFLTAIKNSERKAKYCDIDFQPEICKTYYSARMKNIRVPNSCSKCRGHEFTGRCLAYKPLFDL